MNNHQADSPVLTRSPWFWEDTTAPSTWRGMVEPILSTERVDEFQKQVVTKYSTEVKDTITRLIDDIPEEEMTIMQLWPKASAMAETASREIGRLIRESAIELFPNPNPMVQQAVCVMIAAEWERYRQSINRATELALQATMGY